MDTAIHWNRFFDRVYCMHYLLARGKLPRLKGELLRVGLLDSGIFEMRYTCPSKYDGLILREYRDEDLCPNVGYVNICLEVRRVLWEALEMGYGRILLLEDDVAFLKDLGELNRLLETSPANFDIVQYDKFVNDNGWMLQDWNEAIAKRKIQPDNDYVDVSGTYFTSAACIALSRKAMQSMLALMDGKILATDLAPYFMTDCRYAVAVKNLAIQVFYATCNSTNQVSISYLHQAYANSGVDYSLYNVPEGYGPGCAVRSECEGEGQG